MATHNQPRVPSKAWQLVRPKRRQITRHSELDVHIFYLHGTAGSPVHPRDDRTPARSGQG